jgi:hypothetical protein
VAGTVSARKPLLATSLDHYNIWQTILWELQIALPPDEQTALSAKVNVMQRFSIVLAAVAILFAVSQYAASQQAQPAAEPQTVIPVAPGGLFNVLQPGQVVGLERTGDAYRVTVNPRWRTRDVYTVVAASSEGIVLETQNRDLELRLPVYSVLEVAISRTGVR